MANVYDLPYCVLAATSLSPEGTLVTRRAAALARAADAPLHLMHVLPRLCAPARRRSARARLERAAVNLREEFRIPVDPSLARGRATALIAERARTLRARLVVLGAGTPQGLRQLFGFSRAQTVQRAVEAPVLVVAAGGALDYQRILFATDLSPEDAAAIDGLRRRFPGAALHLVHVYQWHLLRPLRYAFVPEDATWVYRARAQAEATLELRRFAAAQRLDGGIALEATLGHVALALRERARELRADLLVLSPERSRLKAALAASVTQSLLGEPPCDVLLMPRGPGRYGRDAGQRAREAYTSPAW